ncbi:trypsin-like serine protease [Cognatishimia sp. WU-CL00825]|uniref:trypsin-like serine peptidase n=1 Tax=Cognatishimia sp. WU-CL00825 TaxID=3127658 RepID=UPI00310A94A8
MISKIKLLVLSCLLFPGPLAAGTSLEKFTTRGDMLGWEAVGRVDLGKGSFCTGVLIAPDQVLTAAHCLFDSKTGAPLDAKDIRFRSGYLNGRSLSDRSVKKYVISEGYEHSSGSYALDVIAKDVALLKLEYPISDSEAAPFLLHQDGAAVTRVQVMSYGQGRAEAMSWQRQCDKLFQDYRLMAFDCDITFGSSGAPVFAMQGTRVRILSLVSGLTNGKDGRNLVIGVQLQRLVGDLQRRIRSGDIALPNSGAAAKRITVGGGKRLSGAKFLTSKQ